MLSYIITILLSLLLIPGSLALLALLLLWRRGRYEAGVVTFTVIYFALVLAEFVTLSLLIGGMDLDGEAASLWQYADIGSILQPVGVLLLLYVLPLIVSLPVWRRGRIRRAVSLHLMIYSALVLLVTCTPIFGVISW